MFGLMEAQWKFTKGIRELVIMAENHGIFRPDMREQAIEHILETSRNMKIYSAKLDGHEQAMIMIMVYIGLSGPVAFDAAVSWCSEYARRHGVTGTVEGCKEIATKLIERSG